MFEFVFQQRYGATFGFVNNSVERTHEQSEHNVRLF